MFETYKPSGRFSPFVIPAWLIAIVIVVALAFVYQMLLRWLPFIWVSFLITMGFGIVIGAIGTIVVALGHCRNLTLGFLIGSTLLLAGVGGKFYFQHMHFRSQVEQNIRQDRAIGKQLQELLAAAEKENPELANMANEMDKLVEAELAAVTFSETIKHRVDNGWNLGGRARKGGGLPVKGVFVYLIWLAELGIIGYFAVPIVVRTSGDPYSEKLNDWANEAEQVMFLPVTSEEMVAKIRSATSVDELLEIPIPQTDESMQFAHYYTHSITGQELEDAYLTVELVTYSYNANGEQTTNEEPLVKYAIITSEQRKLLVENASLLQEALEDYRESVEEEEMGTAAEEEPS